MYYLSSESKGTHQLRGYRKADLRLLFLHMQKKTFSHDLAHLLFQVQLASVSAQAGLNHTWLKVLRNVFYWWDLHQVENLFCMLLNVQ